MACLHKQQKIIKGSRVSTFSVSFVASITDWLKPIYYTNSIDNRSAVHYKPSSTTYAINCNYRIAATLYTLDMVCFRHVIENTLHRGSDNVKANNNNVADACEFGNEPSGSVKCGEFLD